MAGTQGAEREKLRALARGFASEASELLNNTVCHGVRVTALVTQDSAARYVVIVGTSLDGAESRAVPLTLGRKAPTGWFDAQFRCGLDDRGFLFVLSSYFGIYAADEDQTPLCHYDYERDKEGYPAAHLQVAGTCPALDQLPCDRTSRELARLHFPVGGRRYRPTIEDMIEFVVTEGFADVRTGWRQVVDEHRDGFRAIQLRAAIRRDPDAALDVLRDMGKLS